RVRRRASAPSAFLSSSSRSRWWWSRRSASLPTPSPSAPSPTRTRADERPMPSRLRVDQSRKRTQPARTQTRPPTSRARPEPPAPMMRLPPFTYLAPKTVADAARLLGEHGADAMIVAGGTDLYPNMKRRQFEPKVLVGLGGIGELRGVHGSASRGLSVGPMTTLSAVSQHAEIVSHYPALATAAGLVSSPQLRNMGTIGGNVCVDTRCNYYNQSYEWRKAIGFCMKKDGDICLVAPGSPRCWAVSSSDTAPVAIALGATVVLAGPDGERELPVAALYRDDGIEYLAKQPFEVVTALRLPPPDGVRTAYVKLRRRGSIDFPLAGAGVALRLDGDVVQSARIV